MNQLPVELDQRFRGDRDPRDCDILLPHHSVVEQKPGNHGKQEMPSRRPCLIHWVSFSRVPFWNNCTQVKSYRQENLTTQTSKQGSLRSHSWLSLPPEAAAITRSTDDDDEEDDDDEREAGWRWQERKREEGKKRGRNFAFTGLWGGEGGRAKRERTYRLSHVYSSLSLHPVREWIRPERQESQEGNQSRGR